jgi:hypothetical protein
MGKGPKTVTEQKQNTVQDTENKESGEYTGISGGGREDTSKGEQIGHQESVAERQQREESEARSRGQQVTTGGGSQAGSSRNIIGWSGSMPDTEDMTAWRKSLAEYEGGQRDPTIQFRQASAKRDMSRMWQNPFGSDTTPATREAMMRTVFSNIDQQAGQETLQDAYQIGQRKLQGLGLQGELVKMKNPFREVLGTDTTGSMQQTGTTTSDNVSNTISSMTGLDKAASDSLMNTIQENMSNFFGYNAGQSSGASTGHMTGSQTGTSTTQQNQSVLGQIMGGLGGAAMGKMA